MNPLPAYDALIFGSKIRLIQTARNQLNMADADYRALLLRTAGVSSSKAITLSQFDAVMAEFRRLGFVQQPPKNKPKVAAGRPPSRPSPYTCGVTTISTTLAASRQGTVMLPKFVDLNEQEIALIVPLFPATASEFVEVIGIENALILFAEFGGMHWRFSKSRPHVGIAAQRFEEIAAAIGADNAIRLGATFPDEEIYIPRCTIAMNALRDRQIIEDFDRMTRDMSVREAFNQLARRYRRSVTSITKTVNGKSRPIRAKSADPTEPMRKPRETG